MEALAIVPLVVNGLLEGLLERIVDGLLELIDESKEIFGLVSGIRTLKNELVVMKINLQCMDRVIKPQNMCLVEQILREAACDVEDFIAGCNHLLEKPNSKIMKHAALVIGIKANCGRRKKLKEINKNLSRIKEMNFSLNQNQQHYEDQLLPIRNHSIIEYTTLADNDDLVGLESASEEIKQLVLSEANVALKVIGIIGMPAVGKTTLARKIWKDMRNMTGSFHYVLFITISSLSFDLKVLLKNLLEKVTGTEISTRGDEHELMEKLNKELKEKKYLIILDNIWQLSNSWWNSVKSALPKEKNGSCVIITTRLKEVARSMVDPEKAIYHHGTLSEKDSWQLFSKITFSRYEGCEPPNAQVKALAKKIAAKCGGLPLAIKVTAGIMLRKETSLDNWERMSQDFKEELNTYGELLDKTLRMSYKELPLHLKHCMLCFSIFPEDYEISLEEMVHLWASQRLIHKFEGRTTLEMGERYFHELIDHCLLLGERQDIFEERFQTCKLHGMVRATLMKLTKEKNFMLLGDEGPITFPCSPRVGVITGSNYMDHFSKNNSKLRILVAREVPENREFISKSKMCKQTNLRVLDIVFDENSGEDCLDGITNGSLPLLTCLKIGNSRLKALPKFIMGLRDLQTLCLSQWCKLEKLPPEMGHLKKLTVLDVSSCYSLQYLPSQIESLSNLEILLGFKPSRIKGGCGLASLKKFTQLRKLWIQIDSADQIEMRDLVVLCELEKLKVLEITLEDKSNVALINRLDCELPSPLENLQDLSLHGFPGQTSPPWLNPTSLPKLTHLHIYESDIRNFSTHFFGDGEDGLWKLEALVLTSLNELVEEWPRLRIAMPCIRLFKVDECPQLRSLPFQVKNGLGRWVR